MVVKVYTSTLTQNELKKICYAIEKVTKKTKCSWEGIIHVDKEVLK